MIVFREITEDNFRAIIDMKQPENERFVAPNAFSLAQAWLYRDNHDTYPFAIYDDDELIGFMMLSDDVKERCISVCRFMIAVERQNRGYGTEALKKILALIRESGKYDRVVLDYVPANERARHVYEKLGFRPTGEISDGEIVMRLDI